MRVSDQAVEAAREVAKADPNRRRIELPQLPPGVRPDRAVMAMDDWGGGPNITAWANSQGSGVGLYFPGYAYLSELAQRAEYRAPTEVIAKEMTRKWIKFNTKSGGDKSKRIADIEDAFKRFNVRSAVRRALELDGFFGLGHIYIDIDGQENDLDKPLLLDQKTIAKGSLRALRVIEPIWTTPVKWNAAVPTKPYFYRVEHWAVMGKTTHADRLLSFVSRPVPDLLKPSYNFGGMSLSQLIEPYVVRWLSTVQAVNQLISNFSIINLATDMQAVLAPGAGQEDWNGFLNRARMFVQNRNNQGLFLSDKNKEELKQLTVSLAGLSELQAQAQEHMAAPTHIPLVVLTGITPSGLNASSDSEIQVFHNWIGSVQEADARPHIDKILIAIQLNEFGDVDEDIGYEFVDLEQPNAEALSRIRKADADAGIAYIQAGVVDPDEERKRLATDPSSGYNNLTGLAPGPPEVDEPLPGEGGDDIDSVGK
jgi:phage-related protein (TIGR01555 family)